MRVVFLGSQEIGTRCLEVVLGGGHEVVGVGTFEPGAHEAWARDVSGLAETHGLFRIRGRRFRTPEALRELESLAPDILFAIGWRWILPRSVLEIPSKGCLGIHGSLLPRLRGFAPVNWALIRDEKETGPTLFYFDEGVDTGDIVGQRPFRITDDDDAASVRRRIADASVELLEEYLPHLAEGTAPRIAQRVEGSTYGEQRRPEDGAIDWTLGPRQVFNWVRGLTRPYPGAFAFLRARKIFVWKCRPVEGKGPGPGRHAKGNETALLVGAGLGLVEILEASFEGDEVSGAFDRVVQELRSTGGFDGNASA